jgi:hypothetical protein
VAVTVAVLDDDVRRAPGADRLYRRSAFNCHCSIGNTSSTIRYTNEYDVNTLAIHVVDIECKAMLYVFTFMYTDDQHSMMT